MIKNIWADTMEYYFKDKDEAWYDIPSNVVGTLINPINGELADKNTKSIMAYYIKGTEPSIEKDNLDNLIPVLKED